MSNLPIITTVITDMDNTLWDWFTIWYSSFHALLDALVKKTGITEDKWLPEIKKVHEKHQTVEYAFLLEELPTIQELYPKCDVKLEFKSVIDAHRTARKASTQLYPTVLDTLTFLKKSGVRIISYSESLSFYSIRRIRNTNLDGILDYVYTPSDHKLPEGISLRDIRVMPDDYYNLSKTQHRSTPAGLIKPAPLMLKTIINDCGANRNNTIYIGDSLIKDVRMAKEAGVIDVYAEYGSSHNDCRYELLKSVTHWPSKLVEGEAQLTKEDEPPSYTLQNSFDEILKHFNFA